uniref:Interferon alpha-inducible protein n=1 Tax=Rhipicephalus zambeziensis TaxID=60191 RepID=A0A224YM37_9ACAR
MVDCCRVGCTKLPNMQSYSCFILLITLFIASVSCEHPSRNKRETSDTSTLLAVGGALVGAAGAVMAAPALLAAAGFGAAGVAAGSMAAAAQATMGGVVAKGSVFAICQSWGAAGVPLAVKGVAATAGAWLGFNAAE